MPKTFPKIDRFYRPLKFFFRYRSPVEDDLNRHFKNHTSTISSLKGKLSALKTKKFGSKLNDVVQGLEDLVDKESPEKKYQPVIGQIRSTCNSKAEYRILPDGTVYQKIA